MHITRRAAIAGAGFVAAEAIALAKPSAVKAPAPLTLKPALAPLARFIGTWQGVGEGEPGSSSVTRVYAVALGGQFLKVSNWSSYKPQIKNPSGEEHQDEGYFSFDKARKRFVLRQFHSEGFVNQFVATGEDFVGDTFVVESETLENIGAGFKARETYRFSEADAFEEIFEIAEPGGVFAVYSHNRLRRR